LSDVIASLNANSTDNLVVCGDVNCPGPTPSSVDVALAEMLDSLGLTQLVGSPAGWFTARSRRSDPVCRVNAP